MLFVCFSGETFPLSILLFWIWHHHSTAPQTDLENARHHPRKNKDGRAPTCNLTHLHLAWLRPTQAGLAWRDVAWARLSSARLGMTRLRLARLASAWLGSACLGLTWLSSGQPGSVRLGLACCSMAELRSILCSWARIGLVFFVSLPRSFHITWGLTLFDQWYFRLFNGIFLLVIALFS